jgi:hypothetical protein
MACAIHGSATCPDLPCPGAIQPNPDNIDPVVDIDPDDVNDCPQLSSLGTPDDLVEARHDWDHLAETERARNRADLDNLVATTHERFRADPSHGHAIDTLDAFADAIRAQLGNKAVDE